MNLWQVAPQLQSEPHRMTAGEPLAVEIGTWPIEPGQAVWIKYRVQHLDNTNDEAKAEAIWRRNDSVNSYWEAHVGPFAKGDRVNYEISCVFHTKVNTHFTGR